MEPSFARSVAVVSAVATAVALAAATLVYLHRIVLWLILGLVLAELFARVSSGLARRLPGPRGLWIAAVLLGFLGLATGAVALVAVPLVEQGEELVDAIPRAVARVEGFLGRASRAAGEHPGSSAGDPFSLPPFPFPDSPSSAPDAPSSAARAPGDPPAAAPSPGPSPAASPSTQASLEEAVTERLPAVAANSVPLVLQWLDGAFDALGVVFLAAFVAAAPEEHRRGLLRLLPPHLHPRAESFLDEASGALRGWLAVVGASMLLVGAGVTAGLFFLDVHSWLVFGAFAAAAQLVPYAGPLVGALGPVLECLLDGEPGKAALVALLYASIQVVVGDLVMPSLVGQRTEVPASLALASILGLGAIAGILGIVVAVPFAALALAAARTLIPREPAALAGAV